MSKRKRIGLISVCPESDYQQRVMSGIFEQCTLYDYDVLVFAPLVHVSIHEKEYLAGELNIFNLINFEKLDGVIVTPISMIEENKTEVVSSLLEKVKAECKIPVISVDIPFGDYERVCTDHQKEIAYVTEHVITKHNCKNLFMLTGPENDVIARQREDAFKKTLEKFSLPFEQSHVFYGDFWYTSGIQLAQKFIDGKIPLPDAVVCASDHMAIGLTNHLIKNGIKIPDQVIVTGYECTQEAVMNKPPVTSYLADEERAAKLAVNRLREQIEPGANLIIPEFCGEQNLFLGTTCGCKEDSNKTRDLLLNNQILRVSENVLGSGGEKVDLMSLQDCYISEALTATKNPEECLTKIYETKYILKPYNTFSLCLNENWFDSDFDFSEGYSKKMSLAMTTYPKDVHGFKNHVFFGKEREKLFDTKDLSPLLEKDDEDEVPQVYYFVPVHFNNISFGYAVLQNDLTQTEKPNVVFRTYLSYINNALEMNRIKYKITDMSEHDLMTGLLNRRGMENYVEKLKKDAAKRASKKAATSAATTPAGTPSISTSTDSNENWIAFVADMDGLKYINDNFGHAEGDEGVKIVAQALKTAAEGSSEFCVRAGGDEFYLIGSGNYTDEIAQKKLEKFNKALADLNKDRTLQISASIGYAIIKHNEKKGYISALEQADVKMYQVKRAKKEAGQR